MDTKIPEKEIKKRKRRLLIRAVGVSVLVAAGLFVLGGILRSGVSSKDIELSTVDKGTIEVSVSATGKVTPLTEEVITSPVSSKIVEVYKKAGDMLNAGDVLLRLDLDAANADFGKLKDEMAMKHCKLEQQRVTVSSRLSDLKMQVEIAEMKLKRLAVELRNEHYLDSIGASTSDKVKQAELNYKVEQLLFQQLKQKYRNEQLTSSADLKVSALEYNISKKSAVVMGKTMSEAQVRSPRAAVLTWINNQIGSAINQGANLAVISDLNNYKVEAEISDSYADRISTGARAIVRIGSESLEGLIGNVVPSVKNGVVGFTVMLKECNHAKLRSGLKVDVYVIDAIRDGVRRLANRSYYVGKGEYELWVVNNGVAQKRKVTLGDGSYDFVEVVSGLDVGDRVIVSDMAKYKDAVKLKIRK